MCSFILGSDKDFFDSLSAREVHEFFHDVKDFFEERYGTENILSAVVHLDETTPHMHLNLIPVFEGRLCAKKLFDRVELRELQSDFHEKVGKKWGLNRGKIGSTAKHLETTEFKAKKIIEGAEQQAEETKKQARQQAEDYLQGIHSTIEAESSKPVPKKKKQAEEEIKTLRTENAAYKEHLKIKNEDAGSLFRQLQESERKNRGNDTAFRMVSDMIDAYPDEFDALLKKSREKKNPSTPTPHTSIINGQNKIYFNQTFALPKKTMVVFYAQLKIMRKMTEEQLSNILKFMTIVDCSDEVRKGMLEMAATTLTADRLKDLISDNVNNTVEATNHNVEIFKFTKQEILKMPQPFRKDFRTAGCVAHVQRRKSGKNSWNYMIRYRKHGYNILACSNNLEEAKQKFIAKLCEADAIAKQLALPQNGVTQPKQITATIIPQAMLPRQSTAYQPLSTDSPTTTLKHFTNAR